MLPIDRKAYTIRSDNYPTIIIINGRYEPKSQLVLCAHELGHALLHSDDINNFAVTSKNAFKNVEYEANLFAVSLLFNESDFNMKVLNISNYLLKQVIDYNIAFEGLFMEFSDVIKNRYSCKKFSSEQIGKDKLDAILEAGRVAPTAKNLQEQHIYVVQSESALETIDKLTLCRYNAPTVLIVAFNKNNVFTYPGEKRNSGIEEATIVATHLMLAAYNEGVDSCWINFFNPDELAKALNLPEDEEILMLLDLGVADKTTTPLPNHNSRKALTETVSFI